jgi:hypothetical protein
MLVLDRIRHIAASNKPRDYGMKIRHDVLLLLYVDDILLFHTNDSAGEEIKKPLKDKYK